MKRDQSQLPMARKKGLNMLLIEGSGFQCNICRLPGRGPLRLLLNALRFSGRMITDRSLNASTSIRNFVANAIAKSFLPGVLKLCLILLLSIPVNALPAQSTLPYHRIWLLANTADIKKDTTFFKDFRMALQASEEPVEVLINGDLIRKCTGEDEVPKLPVDQLLKSVAGLAHVSMTILPGDRDWNNSRKGGLDCVKGLEDLVKSYELENVKWPIENGCPGPEKIDISPDILLVTINTQWWNHPHRKPIPADAACDVVATYDIMEELEDAISENQDRNVLIAGHFPPFSLGRYGGRFPLLDHFLPPFIGSINVAFRQHVGTARDITNPKFRDMAARLRTLGKEYDGMVFIGGQERNQQIIFYEGNYLINSGAPEKTAYVAKSKRLALLAKSKAGFMEMVYYRNGAVQYQFRQRSDDGFQIADQDILFQSPCQDELVVGLPVNKAKAPCWTEHQEADAPLTEAELQNKTVVPGSQYKASKFKQVFFGKHYRETWTTPIEVPTLNLDTAFGGLTIQEKGGGRQTKSLKLESPEGKQLVFRSVDKDPTGALNYPLRNTIIAAVTRDQTSTEHPYGAIVVAPMLEELGILHATPKLYVMPDVERLGPFRPEFGGMLGMLEERPSGVDKDELPFAQADEIYKSFKLFEELYEQKDVWLDDQEFARARLFDILVGDWSKHEDNWKWAGFQKGKDLMVRPIPRDRDHVFSKIDGFFPWLADREWAIPNLETFDYKVKSIRSLTFQARHMDRLLANELSREDWLEAARFIQSRLTDSIIDQSVGQMPLEAYVISGNEIAEKLKTRIKDLDRYAMRFYELLCKEVEIIGTNKEERFEVLRNEDGTTEVKIFEDRDDPETPYYYRKFYPNETKEIRLFGLHDRDDFVVEGNAQKAIKLLIIGGPGEDNILDRSNVRKGGRRTIVYEKSDDATIELGEEGRRIDTWNEALYHYDRTAFAYNDYLPLAYITFNTFNGITLKGGVTFTRHNYHKQDYSAKHDLGIEGSTIGNFGFEYEGKYRHVLHKWDLVTQALIARPANFNFFFGEGNGTTINEDLFDQDYYLIRQNAIHGKIGLSRDFWVHSSASVIAGYENNDVPTKANTILQPDTSLFGVEQLDIFNLVAQVEVDLRDHQVFPTKGLRFSASHEMGTTSGNDFGITDAFLEYYLSPAYYPLTLGLKVGYSTTFGQVPFFKKPQLGQNNGLRGFQRNRFTGDSRLYFNSELGVPVATINTPVLPFRLGLRAFYDVGRVYQKDNEQESKEWHRAYGGGFYLIPLTRSYTLGVLVGASEEESAVVSFQLGTNF